MKPITHPPEALHRAYCSLIREVFTYIRQQSADNYQNLPEIFDLADAMHNSNEVIMEYGQWINDEDFRRIYLRPYDRKWEGQSIALEQTLDRLMKEYSSQSMS